MSAVPEPFDPYRKWLGIPVSEQPAHHYRLLGIALFEDDADVIDNAAMRQIAHVRTFQHGPHATLSQKLLNELAAARARLLQPAKKAAYDEQLRGGQQPAAAPVKTSTRVSVAAATTAASTTAAPATSAPATGKRQRWRAEEGAAPPRAEQAPPPPPAPPLIRVAQRAAARIPRRHSSQWLVAGVSLAAGFVFSLGGLIALSRLNQQSLTQRRPEQGTTASASRAPAPAADPALSGARISSAPVGSAAVRGSSMALSPASPAPFGSATAGAPAPASAEPPLVVAARQGLARARAALHDRDEVQFKLGLLDAERSDLPADVAAEAERLRTLKAHIDQFWQAVRRGIYEKLQPGQTYRFRDDELELVGREGEYVRYKLNGEPQQAEIRRLDRRAASLFARASDERRTAEICIQLGAFLLFDGPDGRRRSLDMAGRLWQEAARLGVRDAALGQELGLAESVIFGSDDMARASLRQPRRGLN